MVPVTSDAVVVGAGAIGSAIGWRLAQAGMDVVSVDSEPGRGASWAAAGMLAPVTEVRYGEEGLLRLTMESRRRWRGFAAELETQTGTGIGYRECGTLLVARDRDDLAEIEEIAAFMAELDLPVRRLRARQVRELEPALAARTRGGIHVPGDHQVDNRALVDALAEACRRSGVRTFTGTVESVSASGGHVDGVVLADGREVAAPTVVVAAGPRTPGIAGVPPLPVRPVKGQLVHLRDPSGLPIAARNVRGLGVYVVPRADGRTVVGATVEERGFDTTTTAGAVLELLREAYELLPGLAEHELIEVTAGLRPGTPDNAPVIGRIGPEGLVVATGHYRSGILLTPVTADAVRDLVVGASVPDELAACRPDRFHRVPETVG